MALSMIGMFAKRVANWPLRVQDYRKELSLLKAHLDVNKTLVLYVWNMTNGNFLLWIFRGR